MQERVVCVGCGVTVFDPAPRGKSGNICFTKMSFQTSAHGWRWSTLPDDLTIHECAPGSAPDREPDLLIGVLGEHIQMPFVVEA